MKKILTATALLMLASNSFAAAKKNIEPEVPFEGKPAVVLQVFELGGKVARPIKGNQLNIAKKQSQLCWRSINVVPQTQNLVAEAFYAPAAMKLVSPSSKIDVSDDKKNYTIVTELKSQVNDQYLSRCWQFDNTDPVGKYQMEIQINDQVFKGLSFEIVE